VVYFNFATLRFHEARFGLIKLPTQFFVAPSYAEPTSLMVCQQAPVLTWFLVIVIDDGHVGMGQVDELGDTKGIRQLWLQRRGN
jgi:hypothetical protein